MCDQIFKSLAGRIRLEVKSSIHPIQPLTDESINFIYNSTWNNKEETSHGKKQIMKKLSWKGIFLEDFLENIVYNSVSHEVTDCSRTKAQN